MSRKVIVLAGAFLLLFFLANPSSAHRNEGRVLGDATQAAQVSFSEVTAGPGVILPNSPLFFIDKIYQQLKLALANSPEEKAKVRAEIIGERLAEVKVMILRDNEKGLQKALQNLTEESNFASADLDNQAEEGENVEEAAKTLNETLKQEKEVLNSLSEHSTGSVGFTFRSAGEKVKKQKMVVEDRLPDELLQREIEDGLKTEIESQASEAAHTTLNIKRSIIELQKRASDAAVKEQQKRLEAIKKAIAKQNEQQRKKYELLLKLEKKKQEELKKRQEMLRKKAEEAAKATSELEKEVGVSDIQKEEPEDNLENFEEVTTESKDNDTTER